MKQELAMVVDKLQQFDMEGADDEEYCKVRHFSISGRKVVNRGDSFKVKRPVNRGDSFKVARSVDRSDSSRGTPVERSPSGQSICSLDTSGCETSSPRRSPTPAPTGVTSPPPIQHRVAVLGGHGVGKSSLISQFMTSDFLLHAYDYNAGAQRDKTLTVLLNGVESELIFTSATLQREPCDPASWDEVGQLLRLLSDHEAFLVLYSVEDRHSFLRAAVVLEQLALEPRAVILVANKVDLVRRRVVSEQEGKNLATASNCKYIESSVAIQHQTDELLVGLVTQIRLRSGEDGGSSGGRKKGGKYRRSRTSSSFRGLLSRLRIAKSRSCHDLLVL